ncbi:hypothetical protein CONPUDRAFT_78422 [Coniophora puteana RWD-64-598 SS2]|uniref:Uncharacterized protein n=1 Tax=Coniophora puteana (strain RWD-64-598) TaxID=741705 RepID=R7SDG3_CONPW|nr:uncharacterized protein CONPUDRAFT_78422 [Coniophora puteana RWD-64-598 SS2]EIW73920.1 hypothetical protein CONPUDRAFT_78422 [Coniophora puteana RWD-64-598 SS2]
MSTSSSNAHEPAPNMPTWVKHLFNDNLPATGDQMQQLMDLAEQRMERGLGVWVRGEYSVTQACKCFRTEVLCNRAIYEYARRHFPGQTVPGPNAIAVAVAGGDIKKVLDDIHNQEWIAARTQWRSKHFIADASLGDNQWWTRGSRGAGAPARALAEGSGFDYRHLPMVAAPSEPLSSASSSGNAGRAVMACVLVPTLAALVKSRKRRRREDSDEEEDDGAGAGADANDGPPASKGKKRARTKQDQRKRPADPGADALQPGEDTITEPRKRNKSLAEIGPEELLRDPVVPCTPCTKAGIRCRRVGRLSCTPCARAKGHCNIRKLNEEAGHAVDVDPSVEAAVAWRMPRSGMDWSLEPGDIDIYMATLWKIVPAGSTCESTLYTMPDFVYPLSETMSVGSMMNRVRAETSLADIATAFEKITILPEWEKKWGGERRTPRRPRQWC